MMVRALRVPSLLYPWSNQGVLFPTTHTHTTPTDISTHEGGKRRGKERGEDTEEFSQEEWNGMSEQIISQLYFHVAKIYQPIIYNLEHKNIPFLFNTFDELFVNNDTMIIIAKRGELDNFKIKIDKKLPEQIMKFEEMIQVMKDLRGVVSDSDLIYILIKALPTSYREKISNALAAGPNIKTFTQVRKLLLSIFERDVAWSTLPSDIEPPPSQEFRLPGIHGRGERGRDRGRGGKGGSERGRGRGNGAVPQSYKEYLPAPSSPNLFCYNCNKSDHHTMKCPLPLTLEAREKMRGHRKNRSRGGGEMGDRYKKKEKDFIDFALGVFPHVFLDPPIKLGVFTVPNTPSLPFINPLLSFASCDDLGAEEGSSMSAVEPHGNTH
jgi:hypothetical protein